MKRRPGIRHSELGSASGAAMDRGVQVPVIRRKRLRSLHDVVAAIATQLRANMPDHPLSQRRRSVAGNPGLKQARIYSSISHPAPTVRCPSASRSRGHRRTQSEPVSALTGAKRSSCNAGGAVVSGYEEPPRWSVAMTKGFAVPRRTFSFLRSSSASRW